jgi:hypothetical protein
MRQRQLRTGLVAGLAIAGLVTVTAATLTATPSAQAASVGCADRRPPP